MVKRRESNAKSPNKTGDVMDIKEAAAFLRVSTRTVHRLLKNPESGLPHARVGDRLLFHRQNLSQWIAQGGAKPPDPLPENPTLQQVHDMVKSGKATATAPK